jgi:APA family basic amino acid/polyamine antiporter
LAEPTQAKVFARDATGLVRELGFRDHLLISQGIVLIINGFVTTVLFAPYFFPGANLYAVFALGGIPPLCMAYVYGKLSAGMSRSGGDYVWSTRIVGPIYGTIQVVFLIGALVYYNVFNLWDQFVIGLGPSFFGVGVAIKSSSLVNLATNLASVSWGFPLSFVVLVVIILIALLGIRVYSIFCRISVPTYLIVVTLFALGVGLLSRPDVASTFNSAMSFVGSNTTYNNVISTTTKSGFPATSFSVSNTLLAAIPWGFLTYVGFNFSSYAAGETKNVKTSIYRAYILSWLITIVSLEILTYLVYSSFTTEFLNSLAYVAGTNPASFPVDPFPNFLLALQDPVVGAIVGVGLFLGWMINSTGLVIFSSRMVFAASMDRILPRSFANVSDRFHSPHVATFLIGVLSGAYLTVYWEYGAIASILNSSTMIPIGLGMPLLAAGLFPIIRPQLYKRIFGSMKNAWLMSLAGFVGAAGFAIYVISETSPLVSGTYLGASLADAYAEVGVIILVALGILAWGRYRARQAGTDLKTIFSEIPPE